MPQTTAITAARVFAIVTGLFLFLTVVKFGDPIILEKSIEAPADLTEAFYESWPSTWALPMLLPVFVAAVFAIRWQRLQFRWFLLMPAVWLIWEFIASAWTVSPTFSGETLRHFSICAALFYAGYFCLDPRESWAVWAGLGLGLCVSMRTGLQQHFGGLAETVKMLASNPGATGLPPSVLRSPEFLKRIGTGRIFGTFVYPNTFAGGLLLLLPMTLALVWKFTAKVQLLGRLAFVLILGGCGLACLFWSGSKAGWLIALVCGSVALWHSGVPRKWKVAILSALLVAGLAGFAVKYAHFFEQQRNSVGARFQYWLAAGRIIAHHPLVGTGPGTFSIPFARIKPSDAEMAKLCHNDYLEQGCDSGIFALLVFTLAIFMFLTKLYRYSVSVDSFDWLDFAIWIGLLGVCLQMLVEFHLYIPALAWPLFFIFGAQLGRYINVKGGRKCLSKSVKP